MSEFERYRKMEYINTYKEKQLPLDHEKKIHSPELYAVWNLKTYLLSKVVHKNPYKSEFFIYTDSGAWRGRKFSNWPDENIAKMTVNKIGDRILYGQIGDTNDFSIYNNIIQG